MSSGRDFYTFKLLDREVTFPRVSSIIRIIDKSNPLIWWATNVERAAFKLALEDVLTSPGIANDPQTVYDMMMAKMDGKRAHVRARDDAANIGTGAHETIRWHTLKMMGQDNGKPEPQITDASMRAVLAWLDWAAAVNFTPIDAELFLYCSTCAVAGTTDVIAKVNGLITVIDYKTAPPPKEKRKCRVYPEALIQTQFYRHLARVQGIDVAQTMVVRLPKTDGDIFDPTKDAVLAPEIPLRLLQGIATTWRTMQWLEGAEYGTPPSGRHPEGVDA